MSSAHDPWIMVRGAPDDTILYSSSDFTWKFVVIGMVRYILFYVFFKSIKAGIRSESILAIASSHYFGLILP